LIIERTVVQKKKKRRPCRNHDRKQELKKNPCPDCDFCQWCNDSKCGLCRPTGKDPMAKKKPHRPMFLKY
jgi:hypothetical protein